MTWLGLAFSRGDVEGAGLIFLGTGVAARALLLNPQYGWGWPEFTITVSSVLIVAACIARLSVILPGHPTLVVPIEALQTDDKGG